MTQPATRFLTTPGRDSDARSITSSSKRPRSSIRRSRSPSASSSFSGSANGSRSSLVSTPGQKGILEHRPKFTSAAVNRPNDRSSTGTPLNPARKSGDGPRTQPPSASSMRSQAGPMSLNSKSDANSTRQPSSGGPSVLNVSTREKSANSPRSPSQPSRSAHRPHTNGGSANGKSRRRSPSPPTAGTQVRQPFTKVELGPQVSSPDFRDAALSLLPSSGTRKPPDPPIGNKRRTTTTPDTDRPAKRFRTSAPTQSPVPVDLTQDSDGDDEVPYRPTNINKPYRPASRNNMPPGKQSPVFLYMHKSPEKRSSSPRLKQVQAGGTLGISKVNTSVRTLEYPNWSDGQALAATLQATPTASSSDRLTPAQSLGPTPAGQNGISHSNPIIAPKPVRFGNTTNSYSLTDNRPIPSSKTPTMTRVNSLTRLQLSQKLAETLASAPRSPRSPMAVSSTLSRHTSPHPRPTSAAGNSNIAPKLANARPDQTLTGSTTATAGSPSIFPTTPEVRPGPVTENRPNASRANKQDGDHTSARPSISGARGNSSGLHWSTTNDKQMSMELGRTARPITGHGFPLSDSRGSPTLSISSSSGFASPAPLSSSLAPHQNPALQTRSPTAPFVTPNAMSRPPASESSARAWNKEAQKLPWSARWGSMQNGRGYVDSPVIKSPINAPAIAPTPPALQANNTLNTPAATGTPPSSRPSTPSQPSSSHTIAKPPITRSPTTSSPLLGRGSSSLPKTGESIAASAGRIVNAIQGKTPPAQSVSSSTSTSGTILTGRSVSTPTPTPSQNASSQSLRPSTPSMLSAMTQAHGMPGFSQYTKKSIALPLRPSSPLATNYPISSSTSTTGDTSFSQMRTVANHLTAGNANAISPKKPGSTSDTQSNASPQTRSPQTGASGSRLSMDPTQFGLGRPQRPLAPAIAPKSPFINAPASLSASLGRLPRSPASGASGASASVKPAMTSPIPSRSWGFGAQVNAPPVPRNASRPASSLGHAGDSIQRPATPNANRMATGEKVASPVKVLPVNLPLRRELWSRDLNPPFVPTLQILEKVKDDKPTTFSPALRAKAEKEYSAYWRYKNPQPPSAWRSELNMDFLLQLQVTRDRKALRFSLSTVPPKLPFLRRNIRAGLVGITAYHHPDVARFKKVVDAAVTTRAKDQAMAFDKRWSNQWADSIRSRRLKEEQNPFEVRLRHALRFQLSNIMLVDRDSGQILSLEDFSPQSRPATADISIGTAATRSSTVDCRTVAFRGLTLDPPINDLLLGFKPEQWSQGLSITIRNILDLHGRPWPPRHGGARNLVWSRNFSVVKDDDGVKTFVDNAGPVKLSIRDTDRSTSNIQLLLSNVLRWEHDNRFPLKPIKPRLRTRTLGGGIKIICNIRDEPQKVSSPATSEYKAISLGWTCVFCGLGDLGGEEELHTHFAIAHRAECQVEETKRRKVQGELELTFFIRVGKAMVEREEGSITVPVANAVNITKPVPVVSESAGETVAEKEEKGKRPVPSLPATEIATPPPTVSDPGEKAVMDSAQKEKMPQRVPPATTISEIASRAEITALPTPVSLAHPSEPSDASAASVTSESAVNFSQIPTPEEPTGIDLPNEARHMVDTPPRGKLLPSADDPAVLYNPLGLAGPQLAGRKNEYTNWSYRVAPGTLADLMPELDKIYDGGKYRYYMRDVEESNIWMWHHLTDKRRFLCCCWNRWREEKGPMRTLDQTAYLKGWLDAYAPIMRRAAIEVEVKDQIYLLFHHYLIDRGQMVEVCKYWDELARAERKAKGQMTEEDLWEEEEENRSVEGQ